MSLTATIADGGSLSTAISVPGQYRVVAVEIPTWDAAVMTFEVSLDGGATYQSVFIPSGEYTIANVATGAKTVILDATFPLTGMVKFRSGTAGSPVTQSPAVTLKAYLGSI